MVLLIIGIVFILLIFPFQHFISLKYKLGLLIGLFISIQYFRIILFERSIAWLRPFYIKAFICLLNIPIFFLVLTHFLHFIRQFEDYNYTGIGFIAKDIFEGLSGGGYSWLRSSTFLLGIASMILIVLLNFRLIYSVFKYREGPSFLKRK